MDDIEQFRIARNRALDIGGLARDYIKAAEEANRIAEDLGRVAGIKVSKIHGGLPKITGKIEFPEGQMPPPRDISTLPGIAPEPDEAAQDEAA